jgi:excisionase family DNA binding protein
MSEASADGSNSPEPTLTSPTKEEGRRRLCYSTEQLADLLGLSENSLLDYVHQGLVPHLRLGRRLLFPIAAIDEWLLRGAMRSLEGGE